ncbi:MAG: hypothetical protein ACKO7W_23315, partial [Elainella sp.]
SFVKVRIMVYGVLEELPTGIWILSPTGATVSINRYAHRISRLLLKSETAEVRDYAQPVTDLFSSSRPTAKALTAATSADQLPAAEPVEQFLLPQAVLRLHQAVVESRDLFPDRPMIIEDRVQFGSLTIQLRARWLELELDSYVLVMLESPQIHPLAKLSKLIHRGTVRRMGYRFGHPAEPKQFREQLGY